MTFFRSLFLNALATLFVSQMISGVEIGTFENTPNIGADFLFAFIVGTLNAMIFPLFSILNIRPFFSRMAVFLFLF